jgi:serine/threonine protein kinase
MPSTSSPDLLAGRYRLGTLLGRGGMGEVRAGTDLRLDRQVAVKLLRSELADQAELRARFEREARAAARISHPNVVAVFDTGEHHGVPYIVMERLPGTTLADELDAGSCTEQQACTIGLEVLSALDAAHRLGVVHRDIKPGNILRGHDGHVKVADFGIAKIAEDSDPGTTGVLFATAAYLAPERLAGEPATPASDLYSVGLVLYEALAGRPPFRADSALGLVSAISDGRAAPLAECRPDVSPPVVAVIERAMAREPDRRFASATAMAAALSAAAKAPTTVEGTPTLPVADVRAARHANLRAQHAPIAHTEVLEPTRPPENAPPPRPSPPRHRRRTTFVALVATLLLAVVVAATLIALSPGDDDAGPSTPPTSQASGSTIPPQLGRAIDQLDREVQP